MLHFGLEEKKKKKREVWWIDSRLIFLHKQCSFGLAENQSHITEVIYNLMRKSEKISLKKNKNF